MRTHGRHRANAATTCISGIAYAYASASRSVRELAAHGALESEPAVLEGFGFERVNVAVEESPYALAFDAASRLLDEQQDRAGVDRPARLRRHAERDGVLRRHGCGRGRGFTVHRRPLPLSGHPAAARARARAAPPCSRSISWRAPRCSARSAWRAR